MMRLRPDDRETLCVLACIAAVLAATLVHDPRWLAGALLAAVLLSGPGRGALLWRALRVVLPVNVMISAGMVLAGWWAGAIDGAYLVLLNLRVLLLSVLVAWTARAVDFDRALARWPAARRWFAIVRVHIAGLLRQHADYRAAFESRSVEPPSLHTRTRAVAAHGLGLLDRSVHNAEALTLGMRSRGALDD